MRSPQSSKLTDCDLIEGQLYKYTNVVKGFQYRWFVLNVSKGLLEYYVPDEKVRTIPRGVLHLGGSCVVPSEDDGQTFTVSSETGVSYKLKAADAKERQYWVDKLRQVALMHEGQIASSNVKSRSSQSAREQSERALENVRTILSSSRKTQRRLAGCIESFTCTDSDLLLLKATTHSVLASLEQCFAILQKMHRQKS